MDWSGKGASTLDSVEAILARISQVPWFGAVERLAPRVTSDAAAAVAAYLRSCGGTFPVHWAAGWDEAAQVVRGLDDVSSFWSIEDRWRKQALDATRAAARTEALGE